MGNDFDIPSKNYDDVFTFSHIGKAQRKRVYHYLSKHISAPSLRILELNCGTGEDANYLSEKGHHVIATDISEGMVSVAKNKYPKLYFKTLDITKISSETFAKPFDLIFSNFGGLNCLSKEQLQEFVNISEEILTPKGKLILVIMPKRCLWERFYFSLIGLSKEAKRRNTRAPIIANVEGVNVATWYYNPKEIVTLARTKLKALEIRPIGLAIPPSYLEGYFSKKRRLLSFLVGIESLFRSAFWAKYADHYLITFQKK